MKTYRVYMIYNESGYVDVEAETKSEAYDKVDKMQDIDNLIVIDEEGYWETGDCEIVD